MLCKHYQEKALTFSYTARGIKDSRVHSSHCKCISMEDSERPTEHRVCTNVVQRGWFYSSMAGVRLPTSSPSSATTSCGSLNFAWEGVYQAQYSLGSCRLMPGNLQAGLCGPSSGDELPSPDGYCNGLPITVASSSWSIRSFRNQACLLSRNPNSLPRTTVQEARSAANLYL